MKRLLALPYYLFSKYILCDTHKAQVAKWYLHNGNEDFLTNHPLTTESIVIDVGGYTGFFPIRLFPSTILLCLSLNLWKDFITSW